VRASLVSLLIATSACAPLFTWLAKYSLNRSWSPRNSDHDIFSYRSVRRIGALVRYSA